MAGRAEFGWRGGLALAAVPALAGCGSGWGWYVVAPTTAQGRSNLLFLLDGMVWTVALSGSAIVISITLGLLVALPGLSSRPRIVALNRVYVELVRAVPVLVMILWVYYGLPIVTGLKVGVLAAGVIALALSDSAFEAEIFRAGIQSIERGQHEAAEALGLAGWRKYRLVILPQALRRILPALGNQFVYMLKMSSLVSVIGMQELTRRANELVVAEYRPLEIYTVLVLEYLVLILLVSAGVRRLERRLALPERGRPG
jgi:polar amino acid transport system permease protein